MKYKKRRLTTKKCVTCDTTFKTRLNSKKYCNPKCSINKSLSPEAKARDVIRQKIKNTEYVDKSKLIAYRDIFLTLHHYKEPLKSIPKEEGIGYYGALLSTPGGELIQCHLCGELFMELGKHIIQTHHMLTREYRDMFQLARSTALCSEVQRQKHKMNFMRFLATLTPEEVHEYRESRRKLMRENLRNGKLGAHGLSITLETKNKRGTCPDQLLDKIKEVAEQLNHTPSKDEFINTCGTQRYIHLIYKTFGSWSKALKMLGMQPKIGSGRHSTRVYSDDELLEYLKMFAQENNKVPTATDFRRRLLPNDDIYRRRFGSLENARQLAGVYDFVDDPIIRTGYAAARYKEANSL